MDRCYIIRPTAPLFKPAPIKFHRLKSEGPAGSSSKSSTEEKSQKETFQPPWAFTFDLRERETIWTDANQGRLVKGIAREQLDIDNEELERRLQKLLVLVPDLGPKIHTIKVALLGNLLKEVDLMAEHIIKLKELFPDADIGRMTAKTPTLLLQKPEHLGIEAQKVRDLLGIDSLRLDALVVEHPGFLDSDVVAEVLDHLRQLMPTKNVESYLVQNPTTLLSAAKGKKRLGDNPDPGEPYVTK
ncbi:hypothetical protein BSKO_02939 [Bryopsis sp. KO-2023]|nr:hypothetical protein BSKO_02939 [Bryopsis sp. KO-2023]